MRNLKILPISLGTFAIVFHLNFVTGCASGRTGGPCKYKEIETEALLLKIEDLVWTWETDALGVIEFDAASMPVGMEVGERRVLVLETIVKGSCVPYRLLEIRE